MPDRVRHLNKSVDMGTMLSRVQLDLDPTSRKVKKQGYVPITGRQSLVEFDDTSAATSLGSGNPRLICRLDKGHVQMEKVIPRSDSSSIYTHGRDAALQKWLNGTPNQIESVDQAKASANFALLGGRYGHLDQRALKFSYKKTINAVESAYSSDRKDFFKQIIKNKGFKMDDLKLVYEKKGLLSKSFAF